jgi:hypothetical protein
MRIEYLRQIADVNGNVLNPAKGEADRAEVNTNVRLMELKGQLCLVVGSGRDADGVVRHMVVYLENHRELFTLIKQESLIGYC